jgi:RNA recognition motif-containing protein
MGPKVLAQQKHGESSTLFIGNLPFDATEDELRDLVESNAEEQFTAPKEDEEEEAEGEGEGDDDEAGEDGEDKPQTGSKRGGAKSGLIKTRLAQFEDTGRCKG